MTKNFEAFLRKLICYKSERTCARKDYFINKTAYFFLWVFFVNVFNILFVLPKNLILQCDVLQEPLNSNDDVSEEDPSDLFDTENVVVCQYDKVCCSV